LECNMRFHSYTHITQLLDLSKVIKHSKSLVKSWTRYCFTWVINLGLV
jgi:hypothetical protein